MRKILLLFTAVILLTSFRAGEKPFTGKILYKYSFTDLKGNDISDRLTPYVGSDQHYYIDSKSYKSYSENKLQQLYHSTSNTYYAVSNGLNAQKISGSTQTSKKCIITPLNVTENVAGYACKAVRVETDDASTVYFYSPEVKVDKAVFAKHAYGEWNKYLEATDGAITLKFVMTSKKNGFVWTSTATEVKPMEFAEGDFDLPESVQVKE